jgi:hypothetical protein
LNGSCRAGGDLYRAGGGNGAKSGNTLKEYIY